ncbi:MAG: MPT63 family protein [Mycolicibacterium frederiksbergense]|nr:MPT63 family protein [Mycolicibacterium frederiksbergense]
MNARKFAAVAAGAAVVAVGPTNGPLASADPTVAGFGTQLRAADIDGAGLGGYTVHDLQPSGTDVLSVPIMGDVPLAGVLWEARTDVDAVAGTVVPAMQYFSARTSDGQSYRVLVQALAPDLRVSPLREGGTSDGKIYFDVTGPAPTGVSYDDGRNRLVWSG